MGHEDEALRLRALALLGEFGDRLAREVLEQGLVELESDVLGWQGSHGRVNAHRVVVRVPPSLIARAEQSHVARDALIAVLAAAIAERGSESLADLRLEEGEVPARRGGARSPYRGPT